jgi:hypothetical protein
LTMLDQSFPGEGNSSSHEFGGERLTLAVGGPTDLTPDG